MSYNRTHTAWLIAWRLMAERDGHWLPALALVPLMTTGSEVIDQTAKRLLRQGGRLGLLEVQRIGPPGHQKVSYRIVSPLPDMAAHPRHCPRCYWWVGQDFPSDETCR